MPSQLAKPRVPSGSKNPPAPNSTFSFPDFSFPAFPLLLHFSQLTVGETMARIVMAVLCFVLLMYTTGKGRGEKNNRLTDLLTDS